MIDQWSSINGHTVAGYAEDVDVSGSVDPFDTPQLGHWLSDRADEFDVIAVWKLDRLSRDSIKLNKLVGWCLDNGKTIVSTSESIDLNTPVGRLIANVIAFLAEGELEAIRERQRASRAKLRQTARWPGGRPPFGYNVVSKQLVIDPVAHAVVNEIVNRVIDGASVSSVADELNRWGMPAPSDYYQSLRGHPGPFTVKWKPTPIRNMLRSRALLGVVHHEGRTVRDDNGEPIQLAPPLIDRDQWELLQAALDKISTGSFTPRDASPLSGLVTCFECGSPCYHTVSRINRAKYGKSYEYRHYRCYAKCGAPMMPANFLEQLAEESFIESWGTREIVEKVYVRGDEHESDMRRELEALDELTAALESAVSRTAKLRIQQQISKVDARIAELEQLPQRESRYEDRPIGKTYGQEWADADTAGKHRLLKTAGITISASKVKNSDAWQFGIVEDHERYAVE